MDRIIEKAQRVKLVIFDVDGVLTTGKLLYGSSGTEYKAFHVHDGLGMKLLMQNKIEVGIITARESDIVVKRMRDLGVTHVYQGYSDKVPAYEDLKLKLKFSDEQIAYVGDDLTDLPLIRRAGLGITVPNSPKIMQQHADWVTSLKGGKGAAREVCDFILQTHGLFDAIIKRYLDR
jgi:3-deoxy-D-manno-octulosonate 8-phosphate phosphatase (KDO 8-P phosphatase)